MFGKQPFKCADLKEITENLVNSNRGFYQIFTLNLGVKPDYALYESCLVPQEKLVLLIVDIGAYRNASFPEERLEDIKTFIEFFQMREKSVILRVAYDQNGHGAEMEPDSFDVVKDHLSQLALVVGSLEQPIFIWQGFMLGNWGEMHGSKYIGKAFFDELLAILYEKLSPKTYICVRKPSHYRMICRDFTEVNKNPEYKRIGLFNDAILASDTDMGTYSKEASAGWGNLWAREEELDFQNQICAYAPNGGEVVFGEGYIKQFSSEEIIDLFRRMKLSYLNRLYDLKVIEEWQKTSYFCKGVWNGRILYDYIAAHLGYRYHIKNASMTMLRDIGDGPKGELTIEVENLGFANAYEEIQLVLMLENAGTYRRTYPIGSIRNLGYGDSKSFCVLLALSELKKYKTDIYVYAEATETGEIIKLANKMDENRAILGYLQDYKINEVKI